MNPIDNSMESNDFPNYDEQDDVSMDESTESCSSIDQSSFVEYSFEWDHSKIYPVVADGESSSDFAASSISSFSSSSSLPSSSDNEENGRSNHILFSDPASYIFERNTDLILQHLNGDEVKNASIVSRKWSECVMNSQQFGRKMVLKIGMDDPSEDPDCNLLALLKTPRNYENVEISIKNNKVVQTVVDILLKKLSKSIKNLKITKIGGYNPMLDKPLSFSQLESLELHAVCSRFSGAFLQNVCSLKKLSVNGIDSSALLTCLQQNPELEEVAVYENAFIKYFEDDWSLSMPFRLKKFSMLDHVHTNLHLKGEFPADQWNNLERVNLMKFVKSQASSLQSLHMDYCRVEDLGEILKTLQSLKSIRVNQLRGDPSKLSLDDNHAVETFLTSKINDKFLHAVLTSFKELKSLYIGKLKTHQFDLIMRSAKKLERFGYFWGAQSEKKNGNFIHLKNMYCKACEADSAIKKNISVEVMKAEMFIKLYE